MLIVRNLWVSYGDIKAIRDVSFEIRQGEIVTLIGSNGAGKSTILKAVSQLHPSLSGLIEFNGHSIMGTPPHQVVELGMAHVMEGRRVFPEMSVQENLELGAYTVSSSAQMKQTLMKVYERFPRLLERRKQLAGTLSGGEQQMLAIGRALVSQPKLMLLDEPSMGLAPILVDEIFAIIQEINRKDGVTILLVEQNAHRALQISNRAYVIESGEIVLAGGANDVAENPKVIEAYLTT